MYCKYCKKKDHIIDNCPDIICRICKLFGHPHWKCSKPANKISVNNKPDNKPDNKSDNRIDNKNRIKRSDIITQIDIDEINDFKKYLDVSWGDI